MPNQNKTFMYILINEETQESAIFKDKTLLCEHINVSTKTILRNEHKKLYKTKDFIVYFPRIIEIKSSRGGYHRGNSVTY